MAAAAGSAVVVFRIVRMPGTMAMLASIKREIGDPDRIASWVRVDGFVLVAAGVERTTNVVNGCSRLLIELFGSETADTLAPPWVSPPGP